MDMGKRFGRESLKAYAWRPLESDSFKRISLLRGPKGIDGLISGICLWAKSVFQKNPIALKDDIKTFCKTV